MLVEDVHTRAAQMDEVMTQVRENCQGFIASAEQEAKNIIAEAEKQTEAMKFEVAKWEEEKKRIDSTHIFEPKIKLDVGGHIFATTTTTLTRFPDTMLGTIFSGRHALTTDKAGMCFIDRDGTHFRYILNFLRSPKLFDKSCIQGTTLTELMMELDYYGLKDLMFPPPPPPPPFAPAKPVIFSSHDGSIHLTITQGDDQLWYMQNESIGSKVVNVCENCGLGWPTGCSHLLRVAQRVALSALISRKGSLHAQCASRHQNDLLLLPLLLLLLLLLLLPMMMMMMMMMMMIRFLA